MSESTTRLQNFLDLSESQITELFEIAKKLWKSGDLLVEKSDVASWKAAIHKRELKKYSINDMSSSELSSNLRYVIHVMEDLGIQSDDGKITTESMDVDKSYEKKLNFVVNLWKNSEISTEVDYVMHTLSPHMSFRNMMFNIKSYSRAHGTGNCNLAMVNFILNTAGKEETFLCEFSSTELNQFIIMMQDAYAELAKLNNTTGG